MKEINFTIVIPVHNGMPYIRECVESALSQDYEQYNIIVLENMSDDGTAEYLDSLNSEKIIILKSKQLLSIEDNWARIKELEMNEYMTILMADDALAENYLSSISQLIQKHPDCNIYRSNLNLMDEQSRVFYQSNIKEKITIYDYLEGRLKHTYTETAAGYCFKTARYKEIGGITCEYKLMHTDDKLFMEAIGKNKYMAISPNHVTNYRCHPDSVSGTPNGEAQIGGFNLWMNWIYTLKDKKLRRIVKDYLPYHLTQIVKFFSYETMQELKKIYGLYKIRENDLYHKWIKYKIKHNTSLKKIIRKILPKKKSEILINVCLASDENYSEYMATAIVSILKNANKIDNLHFYILCNKISIQTKEYIKSLKQFKNFEIDFLDMDIKDFKDLPSGGPHISNTTYFRYKIAELCPNIDKMIYLDCDIIVKKSLGELFNTNIAELYVAGVEDLGYSYGKMVCPTDPTFLRAFYINAGVLLLNLKQWRQDNLSEKLLEYTIANADSIQYGDQDVINRICYGRILPLDYKWNVQDSFYKGKKLYKDNLYAENIIKAKKNPSIIHYTYVKKPWNSMEMAKVSDWMYYDCLRKGKLWAYYSFLLKYIPKKAIYLYLEFEQKVYKKIKKITDELLKEN